MIAPSLTVNDAAASLAWYCDVLGFKVKQRWERDGVLQGGELSAGPVRLYVGQDDWQKGRDRVKGEGFRLYFETTQDVDRLAASIKARGGTLASEPKDEYGTRSFGVHDPTGYKITIASAR
jgi:catechol 2,3-dioxygenase-like lactoylglutathione lyase family enzyme